MLQDLFSRYLLGQNLRKMPGARFPKHLRSRHLADETTILEFQRDA
jgi:hypothetical protein